MPLKHSAEFNPLDYPICFDNPQRLTEIDFWHEHIPFAFTLIQMLEPHIFVELGTHKGDSYCAFCQAVDKLKTETRCYAVDTWEGDEHVGHYEASIYDELKAYHDPRYGSFSTMLRSLFDDTVGNFADKSIDLLHIDGLHTYDAVKHDFETWLPKMSDRGVVLFHDSNVRDESFAKRGYEVWRFFEEVSPLYPSYEFKFGNGLGVLAVGKQVPEPLQPLLGDDKKQAELIGKIFFALGHKVHAISKTKKEQQEKADFQMYLDSILEDRDRVVKDYNLLLQDRETLHKHLEEVVKDRQKISDYLRTVDMDRQKTLEYLKIVEQDRKRQQEYLTLVEQDAKNLREYVASIEQDRQALRTQYDITNKALNSLEKTKPVQLSKNINTLVSKIKKSIKSEET